MHVRVVTFTGAKDIDAGVKFLEEKVKLRDELDNRVIGDSS